MIPEVLTAPWLKRFFKEAFGIPVRVQNASGQKWVTIWIMSDRSISHLAPLKYDHEFPPELCSRCMAIVYKGHQTLSQQTYGGNISRYSISLHGDELRELLVGLMNNPINQQLTAAT